MISNPLREVYPSCRVWGVVDVGREMVVDGCVSIAFDGVVCGGKGRECGCVCHKGEDSALEVRLLVWLSQRLGWGVVASAIVTSESVRWRLLLVAGGAGKELQVRGSWGW